MTRTIDAALTAALAAGSGRPVLTGYIGYSGGFVLASAQVTAYKLTGSTLEFEMPYTGDIAGDQTHIWLKRGVTIAGVEYSFTTGRFFIQSQHYLPNGRQVVKGSLFPKQYYSADGHAVYKTVIDAFCTAFSKTAVYRDPADAWLNYTFMPLGKSIILNDANSFAALLRQKYLIFMADNGNEEILFYSCAPGLGGAADLTYSAAADFFIEKTSGSSRKYIWRDELETVRTDGTATDPLHNLGFLWSTDPAPAVHSAPALWQMTMRPDLRVLDGDIVAVSAFASTIKGFALVTEEYNAPDKGHPHPRWSTTITANEVFGNTGGGAMPSTIERVSNYTPLNTSMFNGILSATENNLQAAMDRIDDHANFLPFGVYSAIAPFNAAANPYDATIDRPMSLLKWAQSFYVGGANDALNYWTINLIRLAPTPTATLASLSTAAFAGNAWQQAVTTTFTNPALTAANLALLIQVVPTGAPGPLYLAGPAVQVAA